MAAKRDFIWGGWAGRFAWDETIQAVEEERDAVQRRTIANGYVLASPDWSGHRDHIPLPFTRPVPA